MQNKKVIGENAMIDVLTAFVWGIIAIIGLVQTTATGDDRWMMIWAVAMLGLLTMKRR